MAEMKLTITAVIEMNTDAFTPEEVASTTAKSTCRSRVDSGCVVCYTKDVEERTNELLLRTNKG